MTHKSRKRISLMVALVLLTVFSLNVSANEVGNGRSYRWFDVNQLFVNADQVNNLEYSTSFIGDGFSEWNNKTGVTRFEWTSYALSYVDFCTPDEWIYGPGIGLTCLRDSGNRWSEEWGVGIEKGFNSGTAYRAVVFLREEAMWADTTRAYAAKHELGHVLGLGHVTEAPSIMYPSDRLGVSETQIGYKYYEIQQKDINDVRSWYA